MVSACLFLFSYLGSSLGLSLVEEEHFWKCPKHSVSGKELNQINCISCDILECQVYEVWLSFAHSHGSPKGGAL